MSNFQIRERYTWSGLVCCVQFASCQTDVWCVCSLRARRRTVANLDLRNEHGRRLLVLLASSDDDTTTLAYGVALYVHVCEQLVTK